MTTVARRSPEQIRRDIARYEAWQTVSTVQAGAAFAAWVAIRLAAVKQELANNQNGVNR